MYMMITMRLWSIHPKYLDPAGLVALWREALLARAVLRGKTAGYKKHPQLIRFKAEPDPVAMVNSYLCFIYDESVRRGYSFDKRKIKTAIRVRKKIGVSVNQLNYEFKLLKRKLLKRLPERVSSLRKVQKIEANPLFIIQAGPVEKWEKVE